LGRRLARRSRNRRSSSLSTSSAFGRPRGWDVGVGEVIVMRQGTISARN
jgi:hypothetical protein